MSGAGTVDKSEQAREKEKKQIEAYKELEKDVTERVRNLLSCLGLKIHS